MSLKNRRSKRMVKFASKCVKDKFNSKIFPLNTNPHNREVYMVNFARTSRYFNSTIPQCQRILNKMAEENNQQWFIFMISIIHFYIDISMLWNMVYMDHIFYYLLWMVVLLGSYHLKTNKTIKKIVLIFTYLYCV